MDDGSRTDAVRAPERAATDHGPGPTDEVTAPGGTGIAAPGATASLDPATRGVPADDDEALPDGARTPDGPSAAGATPTGTPGTTGTGDGPASERPRAHGADLDQAAVDARWRDIVAGWDGPPAAGSGSVVDAPGGRRGSAPTPPPHPLGSGTTWPVAAPPAPQPGDRRRTDRGPIDPARRRENRVDGLTGDLAGPRDHTPVPEDEHFSPPVPTVHPPLEKTTRLGWAGLVAGLVVLVVVVAVGSELLPRWVPLLGVALLVGGFAALVSRLHRSPEDEDDHDPDDGAVV